jgi:hypothetical protein
MPLDEADVEVPSDEENRNFGCGTLDFGAIRTVWHKANAGA